MTSTYWYFILVSLVCFFVLQWSNIYLLPLIFKKLMVIRKAQVHSNTIFPNSIKSNLKNERHSFYAFGFSHICSIFCSSDNHIYLLPLVKNIIVISNKFKPTLLFPTLMLKYVENLVYIWHNKCTIYILLQFFPNTGTTIRKRNFRHLQTKSQWDLKFEFLISNYEKCRWYYIPKFYFFKSSFKAFSCIQDP